MQCFYDCYTRPPHCSLPGSSDPRSPINSTELARDIVEERHTHQEDEQRDADLLAKRLRTVGQRTALQPLDGEPVKILVVDNYDSFVYNLVQYLGQLGATVEVRRNDEVGPGDLAAIRPDGVSSAMVVSLMTDQPLPVRHAR